LTSGEFCAACAALTPPVRTEAAMHIYRGVFRRGDLPSHLTTMPQPAPSTTQVEHGATKFTLRIQEGGPLESESVILPMRSSSGATRTGLCVSSQVGCAMGCTFCETAQMGLLANLSTAQIVAQWFAARFHFRAVISNVVFMGMGEPMDNLDAVLQAIRVLVDPNGAAIAPSRISVSTVGRPQGIRQFARFTQAPGFHRLRLAVSINAPNNEIRSRIMPINRAAPLAEVMAAMLEFTSLPGRRVLIEYVLIPGVNDALAHADELAGYLQPLPCTVNLIPYNPRRESPWPAPNETTIDRFYRRLQAHGLRVTRRVTMGRTMMAACGQLGNEHIRRARSPARLTVSH